MDEKQELRAGDGEQVDSQTAGGSRRDFLRLGTLGAASLAGAVALGAQASSARA